MTTYYVDPAGSDGAGGTSPATAWATVSKVNGSTFSAGDSILLIAGGLWRETLTFPSSGSSGNNITIGSYGAGGKPIISGADILGTSGWTLHTDTPTIFISDSFVRVDASGWGNAPIGVDTNKSWDGGATNFSISSNRGALLKDFGGMLNLIGDNRADDVDVYAEFSNVPSSSDNQGDGVRFRHSGSGSYQASYERSTGTLYVRDALHGTTLTSVSVADPGAAFKLRVWCQTVSGNVRIRVRIWASASGEPGTWSIDYTDSTLKYTSGWYGVVAYNSTGSQDSYCLQFTAQSIAVSYASTYQKSVATDPGYVVLEDSSLMTHVGSIAQVESTQTSFYWSGGVLYLHATGSGDPSSNGKIYESSTRSYGVDISAKSYITVTGIIAECTTFDGNNAGFHIQNGSDHITVDNCIARWNNVWGCVSKAEGGSVPTNITFQNSEAYGNQGYGGFGGDSNTSFIIQDCVAHDNGNPEDTGISGPWHDHGFYVASDAGIIRRCVAYNNIYGSGFSSGSSSTSIKWSYNVSYDNMFDMFIHEGAAGDEIYQHTGYGSDVGLQIGVDGGAVTTPSAVKNCLFIGNGTSGVRVGSGGSGIGSSFANNDVYGAGTSNYAGVASQTGSNGNVSVDPLFVSTLGNNYKLTSGSPVRGIGAVISGINQVNLDLGAYPLSSILQLLLTGVG